MPRTIDDTTQTELESADRSQILLTFLTIIDPNEVDPIRIVCEESKGVSFENGLSINYVLDGNLHYAIPFSFSRMSDDDRPARATLNVPAFSSDIGDWLRNMTEPARLRIQIYSMADWNETVEILNNSRSPVGTPEIIYDANHIWLRTSTGGMSTISVELGGYDFTQEPLGYRATKDLCPDLYRL